MKIINLLMIMSLFLFGFCSAEEIVFFGILEPVDKETIVSKCEAVMVKNVEEGAFVNKGEIIYKLDTADYEERKLQIESELRKLAAEHNANKLNFENRLMEARQKVASRKINYEIAVLSYQDILSGPNEADVKISAEKVKMAHLILENSNLEIQLVKKLFNGGYVTKDELNSLTFRIKNEEESLKLLIIENELIKLGPTSIQIEEAKIINDIRKKELDNTQYQLNSLLVSYDDFLKFQEREYKNRNKKLEKVIKNISDCISIAPISGTVFYERYPWGEKIPIGKSVWEGLKVRSISNLTNMNVKIKVPVESIDQYSLDQKAKVEIFSTGEIVPGIVSKINQIQEDEFSDAHNKTKEALGVSNKKVFIVKVKIIDSMRNLKPGMSAKVYLENKKINEKK